MNITVLGPGAVGSLWACYLQKAGHNVSLWTRNSIPSELPLYLNAKENSSHSFSCNNKESLSQCDLLFITVKAWQVESALLPLLPLLSKDTILLFMHNGMGAIDVIKDQISHHPILQATTTHGALKESSHKVKHTGVGHTVIGPYNASGAQCQFLQEVLDHSLPSIEWNPNIEIALWKKLAINCAINPLTAIHRCQNGGLSQSDIHQDVVQVCCEVQQVLQQEEVILSQSELLLTVNQVISATAENYSSMNRDCFYQRKTEIDFITGFLLQKAKQHGISASTNQTLYNQIKQLEENFL
ncbi:2-dehydropantoate 2-reductase [Aliivibrio sp. S4TY2]|uniref:2-dehydropantoate 2-reductase n=1 Tax=unclassified Aliivibrio TaxID=2645654 RepID=UPI002377DF74|nr:MULTISPECIES: 2-dehydropantoate 2-reductase [unclassified Aliivibrio]MDD9157093.1 2-dehydropantoate 2-reductase [Aliivibrio sp. S4TY2]MDD9161074.1 2-dehydropantoate 2-reductase [Aliivibrio sp. S4TY1]MDD9165005.1 2-dehydropantoate 2-reductase [Aliivibrio sp. S4MY2]MDD9169102.1 2-dehydropantoate 2-reductase [Aliivibrio sp. S4MY4]MDD9185830.1 2-dehydropantoate 2-reductase [Aliivibrio sp. S4MY3]